MDNSIGSRHKRDDEAVIGVTASSVLTGSFLPTKSELAPPPHLAPVRSPRGKAALKNAVLNAWHDTHESGDAIARAHNITKSVVLGIVYRARQAGDPRAIVRRSPEMSRAHLLRKLDGLEAELCRLREKVRAL